MRHDATWDAADPILLLGTVAVNPGVTLTVAAGGAVAGVGGAALLDVQGTLRAPGTAAAPIALPFDGAFVGGSGPSGWGGLRFEAGSAGSLAYASIGGAGANNAYCPAFGAHQYAAVLLCGGSLSLDHVTVDRSISAGLDLESGSAATITNATITNSNTAISVNNAILSIHTSTIANDGFGIANRADCTPAQAQYNWWGTNTGPAPTGTGPGVSSNVVFAPYSTSSIQGGPGPSGPPGGLWVSPGDGETVGDSVILEAWAYPRTPGGSPITSVNLTAFYGGAWLVLCTETSGTNDGLYECPVDLSEIIPPGDLTISFDVYDLSGQQNLAPNGLHTIHYVPGSSSGSSDETTFQNTLTQYPILDEQTIRGGATDIFLGLTKVLADQCLNFDSYDDGELATVCAASSVAGGQFLTMATEVLAQSVVDAALMPLDGLADHSIGGKVVLGATQVVLHAALGQDPNSAVMEQIAEQTSGAMFGKLVGDYLAGQIGDISLSYAEQLIGQDSLISQSVSGTGYTPSHEPVEVSMSYVYNAYTHYVVVFFSSDKAPNRAFVDSYMVDSDGLPVSAPGLPVPFTY